jgi:hypothetical protein
MNSSEICCRCAVFSTYNEQRLFDKERTYGEDRACNKDDTTGLAIKTGLMTRRELILE